MKYILFFALIIALTVFYSCTSKKFLDPTPAFEDKALLDSCKNNASFKYYKNKPDSIYSGTHGPHGNFKLKFNSVAYGALTDNGKIPSGSLFPENSMIVKEVLSGGVINLYAFMYKYKSNWLWAEIKPDGTVLFGVETDPKSCISCHSQTGNRDLVDSFYFY